MEYRITLTRLMFGWSKYGGANHGLVKEELDEWFCQGCGQQQIKGLPSYMIPFLSIDDRDFMRVCSKCKNMLVNKKVRQTYDTLKKLLRLQTGDWF